MIVVTMVVVRLICCVVVIGIMLLCRIQSKQKRIYVHVLVEQTEINQSHSEKQTLGSQVKSRSKDLQLNVDILYSQRQ